MARALRVEFPGAVYHVTSRGNARQAIFRDDADREEFLRLLELAVLGASCLVWALCLMENHYHVVVQTARPNLSLLMHVLNSRYAQAFNRRHVRVGHVFQGRYHAVVVEKERHLLEVCRYVVLNPVRAGLVATPAEWRWSSYRATAGEEIVPPYLAADEVLAQFGADRRRAHKCYRSFVADGLRGEPSEELRSALYPKREEFARRERARAARDSGLPHADSPPVRTPLRALFADHGEHAIAVAYRTEGYRLREVAAALGVHPSTVTRRLRRLEEAISSQT